MTRKKVKSEAIKLVPPKKRTTTKPIPEIKKGQVILPADNKPSRWDKVKGVSGNIVRYKMGDQESLTEIGKLVQKNKARSMCVGTDGNIMYFYYEIFKE